MQRESEPGLRIFGYLKHSVGVRVENYATSRGVTRHRAVVELIKKGLDAVESEGLGETVQGTEGERGQESGGVPVRPWNSILNPVRPTTKITVPTGRERGRR